MELIKISSFRNSIVLDSSEVIVFDSIMNRIQFIIYMNNTLSESKSNRYFTNSPIPILKGKGIWIIGILFQPKSS